MTKPPSWYISTFGGVRAVRGDEVVERFRTQKTASLLVLLALRGQHTREVACALLWPDATIESSRNSLSSALSSLRRDFGSDVLLTDRNRIALTPGAFSTDVQDFDRAVKDQDLARAVDLYTSHLLPGFYDDPFIALAKEYEEKARQVFDAYLGQLEANCTSVAAPQLMAMARRAITLFGNDERWLLTLMRAQHAMGDFDAALRTYEGLQRWNRKSGDVVSEATRQLVKQLRRDKDTIKSSVSSSSPAFVEGIPALQQEDRRLDEPTVNLPPQWTRFFGRQHERDLLANWLRVGEKLVTLSGTGGSGKTRLIIEVARQLASEPETNALICFVPLAPLSDAGLLLSTIRDALGIVVAPDLPPLEQLARALRGQKCLILLDNFEQLLPEGAAVLQDLRDQLPYARFIVTSRVLLRLPGERELPLAPLPTPLPETSDEEVWGCPSAALFCDRANLHFDAANTRAVGTLCRRLDGIPLALELAAARANVLSPAQILERLERHPNFLQSRELGTPARHKTLRTTIEWSVDLLSPRLREFFVKLCVFRSGWTLEAAETISAPGLCQEWETLDLLAQLRDCSLILTEDSPAGTRFRMLEMLREWGQSQLGETERIELEERHFKYYLALVEGGPDAPLSTEVEPELSNLRAALNFAMHQPDASKATRLAGALGGLWEVRALFSEGYDWSERALEHAQEQQTLPDSSIMARLLFTNSTMHWYSGSRVCARERLRHALSLYESLGDDEGQVRVLSLLGRMEVSLGECQAGERSGERAIAIARRQGDHAHLASALVTASWSLVYGAHPQKALSLLDEAITLDTGPGNRWVLIFAHSARAVALYMVGETEASAHERDDLVELIEDEEAGWVKALAQWHVGLIDCWDGNYERARLLLVRAILIQTVIGSRWDLGYNFYAVGELAVKLGDFERAALLFGACENICQNTGYNLLPFVQPHYRAALAELDAAVTPTQKAAWWSRGRQLSVDEIAALAQPLM